MMSKERRQRQSRILFFDRGCPFAHRVLATATALGVDIELREAALGTKPKGIEAYSTNASIPLLVDGDLVLSESRVILEYLAERFDAPDAVVDDVGERALQRLSMTKVETDLVPYLFGRKPMPEDMAVLDEVLTALERAICTTAPGNNVLTWHVAPIWSFFAQWHPGSSVVRAIVARDALHAWLRAAAELPCVANTAADPETIVRDLGRARDRGLVAANFFVPSMA